MSSKLSSQLLLLGFNAAVGGFLFGYDTASMSASLLQVKRPRGGANEPCPGLSEEPLTVHEQEMVTAFVVLGAFLSATVAGPLNVLFGRRAVLLGASLIFAIGALLMAMGQNLPEMLVARVVVGLGVGLSSHTVPLYISECSPVSLRGAMCFLNTLMIVMGQVTAALVSTALFHWEMQNGWRWILGIAVVPAGIMFLGFFLQPESPRWLLSKDRRDEALQTLRILRGANDMEASRAVEIEFEEMAEEADRLRQSEMHSNVDDNTFRSYLKDTHIRRALILGCGLQCLQQWTGINTIMYYGATVLQQTGPSIDVRAGSCFTPENKQAVATTVGFAVAQLVGVLCSLLAVDRVGRRPLILASLAGVVVSLAGIGSMFSRPVVNQSHVVTFILFYLVCFGFGTSPVPWAVNAEIYPLRVRANCISVATSLHWLSTFIVAQSFLTLSAALSTHKVDANFHPDGVFWLYATIATLGFMLLWLFMPETKDVKLEQMSALFVAPEEKHLYSASSEAERF